MAYIGNAPAEAYSTISKQTITGNGTTGPYTLDYAVANGNEIEVFVNNVRQEPAVAYTVSGNALTMTGAVASTDDFYVVFQGKGVQTTTHPAGQSLQALNAQLTGDLKLETSSGGIYTVTGADTSTDRTLTLPDEAGTVLTSASSIPSSSVTGLTQGLTEYDMWRISSTFTTGGQGETTINTNWERVDESTFGYKGTGMTQSSGIFTFPVTGIWFVSFTYGCYKASSERYLGSKMRVSTDGGSNWDDLTENLSSVHNAGVSAYQTGTSNVFIDVTDASQFRIEFKAVTGSSVTYDGRTDQNRTYATFIRLGDT